MLKPFFHLENFSLIIFTFELGSIGRIIDALMRELTPMASSSFYDESDVSQVLRERTTRRQSGSPSQTSGRQKYFYIIVRSKSEDFSQAIRMIFKFTI